MSLGIIIQARMKSTRLPGKILMPIAGRPLLDHILGRLEQSRHRAAVVVATSTEPEDDAVERFSGERDVTCFRGDEHDVLDRYYRCARHHGFDQIVRLTGDNPFYDIAELDNLIDLHLREMSDFSHSFAALPVGVGAEIFSFAALEASHREGRADHHREHVDEFLLEHPERFSTSLLEVPAAKNHPEVRLTVDTPEDYRRACAIADQASGDFVTTEDAIALCLHCA